MPLIFHLQYCLALKKDDLSLKIHKIFKCNTLSRVDFILSKKENKIYFLEINSQPGMTKISLLDIVSNDFLFERTRDKPKIKRIFIILEPIIAPIAISVSFLFKALIVTNNSGSDVPNPMIKIPVIKAGTFSLFDKATDPITNLSPPIAKSKIPIGKSKA